MSASPIDRQRISRRALLGAGAAGAGGLALASTARALERVPGLPPPAGEELNSALAVKHDLTTLLGIGESLPSGYIWTDARILFATVALNPVGFGDWLPPGLRLATPAKATCFIAEYPQTLFGSAYNEAAVLVHIEDQRGFAYHCPWMVVDDDTALVLGRELLGFPKKIATITLNRTAEGMVGSVVRKGVKVLEISAPTASFAESTGDVLPRFVNAFGSVIGGMRLLEVGDVSEQVHERSAGPARLAAFPSVRDPIALWLVPGEADGVLAKLDYGLATDGVTLGEPLPDAWAALKTMQRAL